MKLLIDATMLDGQPSGAATRLAGLGAALAERGDVEALHVVRPGVEPLPGLSCVEAAGFDTPRRRVAAGARWEQLAREHAADSLILGALPMPRVRGLATLLTVHDLRFLDPGAQLSWARRLWGRVFLCANLNRARGLLAVSEHTAARLRAILRDAGPSVHVVPNAPTPGIARQRDPERLAAFRRRLGLNARFALMIGPVHAHKNIGLALRLLASVRAHPAGADLGLVLAGRVEPAGARALARAARRLGVEEALRITGCLTPEQLADALSAADALLVLGRSEGFSIPLVDAQLLGVPVLAVEAGALPEVAGSGAWIEPPDDGPGLASALLAALEHGDLREARLQSARQRALGWSWEASAEALVRAVRNLGR